MNKLNRKELKQGMAKTIEYYEAVSMFDELTPEEKGHLDELKKIYTELSEEL